MCTKKFDVMATGIDLEKYNLESVLITKEVNDLDKCIQEIVTMTTYRYWP